MELIYTLATRICLLLLIFCGIQTNLLGQNIAFDESSNYSGGWMNGSNGGTGFGNWDLWTEGGGSAGHFIEGNYSTCGDVSMMGTAFGMFGNPSANPANQSNAQRLFGVPLQDGNTFSVDFAAAFRNGYKGIDLFTEGFNTIFNFNVSDGVGGYVANGNVLDWAYEECSVFELEATQVSESAILIKVTRGADVFGPIEIPVSNRLFAFKFYIGNTDAGVEPRNNLYFNNLRIRDFAPLPLNLLSFNARSLRSEVYLDWQFEASEDLSNLMLEHSNEGRNWRVLATYSDWDEVEQRANGQYIHKSVSEGTQYYRLRAVGFSGEEKLSPVRSAVINSLARSVRAVNTLVDNELILQRDHVGAPVNLELINNFGQIIQSSKWANNENQYNLYMTGLPGGIYYLKVSNGNTVDTLKLVKQ